MLATQPGPEEAVTSQGSPVANQQRPKAAESVDGHVSLVIRHLEPGHNSWSLLTCGHPTLVTGDHKCRV